MRLFAPPDIDKLSARSDVKRLIKALSSDRDATVRRNAAQALGKVGDRSAVEALARALKDSVRMVQDAAAVALGRCGDARAVDRLIANLDNPSLGGLEDGLAGIGAPAVEPLAGALQANRWLVRSNATRALGKIGGRRAGELLIGALQDRNNVVRVCAAKSLGDLAESAAVEPLIALLDAPGWEDRAAAAGALSKMGDPRASEALTLALDRDDWKGEKLISPPTAALDAAMAEQPAVTSLSGALLHEDPHVRLAAAIALGRIGSAHPMGGVAAVDPLLAALRDVVTEVRTAAAASLNALAQAGIGSKSTPPLSERLAQLGVGPAGASPPAALGASVQPVARRVAAPRAEAQPSDAVTADGVAAVAIACDANVVFDSDEALNGWATNIVRSKWPGLRLASDTHIEGATGFSGSDDEASGVLDDLLNRATAAAAVNRADCEVSYFTARSDAPPTKVWCMVAIKRQSA